MSQGTAQTLIHSGDARGRTRIGWLDSYHTFSFGEFYDPNRMGFRALRVINDDRVAPGAGFSPHGHRDMEILTYVLEGALEHKDSLGNGAVILPGDAQVMSAGTGIVHSEFNPSETEPVHLLQIWLLPDERGIQPRYEQRNFPLEEKQGKLRLIASKNGRDGAVVMHQDVELYTSVLRAGDRVTYTLGSDRYAWLQVAQGEITFNQQPLQGGDGVAIGPGETLDLSTHSSGEILLFDLA